MPKSILTEEQKNEEIKKLIRQKAIERGKLEKEAKHHNRIQSQLQTKQYNYDNNYINNNYTHKHQHQHLCPNCQRKKYQKRRQHYQYVDNYPYYQYQEQYQEEPYYGENYENEDYQNEYQYAYQEEDNNIYEQPKYESKTFQPYIYSLEETSQLLQNARPMFTLLSYGNTTSNAYGTSAYNTNTEPVQKCTCTKTKTKMINDNNNQNVNQQQTQQKNEIKQEIKKEENKSNANANIKNDIKKSTNAREVKKVETKIEKKEEKKVETRDRIGDRIRGQKQQVSSKKFESTCRYNKRGGFGIAKKTEKIRQSSTNKNDKGKRHHLTYEVINIQVEKKE